MTRIGLSCNAFRHSGGLERYAMDLVRGLHDNGITPAVFARRFDRSLPEIELVEPHRIAVNWLPGKLRDAWFSWRLRRARAAASIDVLIGCNRVDSSEIAICGGTHRGFLRAGRRDTRPSDHRQIVLEQRQYDQARFIVAHSGLMRDELIELYGVPPGKIQLLYPPVDARRFTPVSRDARAQLRQQFGFADHEVVLLFPSSSHERKGLPLIEAALKDNPLPVVVAVAGRPPERTSQQIRYIGYAKQIEDCYRAADYTILASNYEPFGLVGIESVLCGTPVIFSSNIACCEVLADEARITFAPGDVDGLRAALAQAVKAATDPARTAPGSSAIRYDMSIGAHVNALLKLVEQVRIQPR
ncbi:MULTISPECIES: glycosyltransferase family 4 protein [Paraburkholderia]|uniref:glycosyltransferase family 4 protein n=1 Tax=Paraburkholderia TaxID=1822464 RepID=UPI002252040A|nr:MULTISPECIES: glycosyltransferase family 4 protein [Paraburkholderia]MCX4165434.1 glycosyltransferase family 4 protein [Paraburkholderia megapolitana]MDN7160926.1 glycosyltransferase family 4 protein [Paraburkholderia sp. CHISQ3]MDQ6497973.1 glycosyltransferase family 4 protein [Paraburkholderia megapolitana]